MIFSKEYLWSLCKRQGGGHSHVIVHSDLLCSLSLRQLPDSFTTFLGIHVFSSSLVMLTDSLTNSVNSHHVTQRLLSSRDNSSERRSAGITTLGLPLIQGWGTRKLVFPAKDKKLNTMTYLLNGTLFYVLLAVLLKLKTIQGDIVLWL